MGISKPALKAYLCGILLTGEQWADSSGHHSHKRRHSVFLNLELSTSDLCSTVSEHTTKYDMCVDAAAQKISSIVTVITKSK
jgi:hypothetical protein